MSDGPRPDGGGAGKNASEFDRFAEGYTGGDEVALKRMLGRDLASWVAVKTDWLLRDLRSFSTGHGGAPRLLDYGCGNGVLLGLLRQGGFAGELHGVDVSAGMLEQARRHWADEEPPDLAQIVKGVAPLEGDSFDLVVASAVLHHVPPLDRSAVYRDVARLLSPGGRAYVFEHNPINPLTRWVVARTPIDENAILLGAGEVVSGFGSAGLRNTRTRYLMFFPPALGVLRPIERALGWLPLGAQYVVVGELPTA